MGEGSNNHVDTSIEAASVLPNAGVGSILNLELQVSGDGTIRRILELLQELTVIKICELYLELKDIQRKDGTITADLKLLFVDILKASGIVGHSEWVKVFGKKEGGQLWQEHARCSQ